MEYSYGRGMKVQPVIKKTVVTSNTTSSENESEQNRSLVEMVAKRPSGFPRHDVLLFTREEFSGMSPESFSYTCRNNRYSTVYELSVSSKITGEGGENRRFIEHYTKPSGPRVEQRVVVVIKEKPQIDEPESVEERESLTKERSDVDIFSISDLLKYPSDYNPKRKEIIVSLGEVEDEEESDEEYDEFEEEIVIVDVRRKPIWRKGLEIPKRQPEKVGIPIEDLLEIPSLNATRESCPDELSFDEKVHYVERAPVAFSEFPDLSGW